MRRLSGPFSGLLILLGCGVALVPVAPQFPSDTPDGAWAFALNAAVAHGLVFGRDIVFTFGPYAAAYTRQYGPANDATMLWSCSLLALALASGLMSLSRDRCRLVAILLALFLGVMARGRDAVFLAIPILFLMLVVRLASATVRSDSDSLKWPAILAIAILVPALALMPLIKVTFVLTSFLVMLLGCGIMTWRGQGWRAAGAALLFVVALGVFWTAAGEPLAALPQFFIAQVPLVTGYDQAMSAAGGAAQPGLVAICCAIVGLANARAFWSAGASGAILAIGLSVLCFIGFKAGFVRHDSPHLMIAPGTLLIAATVMMIGLPGPGPLCGAAVAFACWLILDATEPGASLASRVGALLPDAARGIVARMSADDDPPRRYEESLRIIRAAQPLPPVTGKTDIYSYGQSILLANGLDWAPRPAVQSYAAYTPSLLEADARHLLDASAPENILFSVQPIDARLPALEDGLSWPVLLTRYQPTGLFGGLAVLRRRPETSPPPQTTYRTIETGVFALGEPIGLPNDAPAVWARIEIAPTPRGRLWGMAYKLPELRITMRMPYGGNRAFRFVAGMGRTGFLASPLVEDTADFLALESPDADARLGARRPRSMAITVADGTRWAWPDRFSVSLFATTIPTEPDVRRLLPESPP